MQSKKPSRKKDMHKKILLLIKENNNYNFVPEQFVLPKNCKILITIESFRNKDNLSSNNETYTREKIMEIIFPKKTESVETVQKILATFKQKHSHRRQLHVLGCFYSLRTRNRH